MVPAILKHHNTYCSYADTIMPQFFFAVGFAYRLTFLRRVQTVGYAAAAAAAIRSESRADPARLRRSTTSTASVSHWEELKAMTASEFLGRAFRRELFQTLVHIAITSIWVLPVIAAGMWTRVLFLLASAGLHLWLSSWFYLHWAWNRPVIDGGPLGFLSWTIPLLAGSLAYDAAARARRPAAPGGQALLLVAGRDARRLCDLLRGGGWAPPPFMPPSASAPRWTSGG